MKEAVIVGASDLRRTVLKRFVEHKGYRVLCYIDSYVKGDVEGVPILRAEDFADRFSTFRGVFMFTFPLVGGRLKLFSFLRENFKEAEFWDYMRVYETFREALVYVNEKGWWWMGKGWSEEKALTVLNMLADEKSRQIYRNWIEFRRALNIRLVPDPEEGPQYIPDDIPMWDLLPRNVTFMDVGAHVGGVFSSVLEKLISIGKDMSLYIAFEPSGEAFLKLKQRLNSWKGKALLFRFACGKETGVIHMLPAENDMFIVAEEPSDDRAVAVPVVSPDEILHNVEVNIIKVDVEGHEMNSLAGMRRIVSTFKPLVFISLYHRPEDFHTIPLFLKKLCPDYSFYVRTYGSIFMETVLFAVPVS